MGLTAPLKELSTANSLPGKLLPWALFALIPITLLHLYIYPISVNVESSVRLKSRASQNGPKGEFDAMPCNYAVGQWVPDVSGPLYSGTSCSTIKDGQNCMAHGRPDTGYLNWRWQPEKCDLPRFDPFAFLGLLRNKHLAFVGDSLARNQLESLMCLVATASDPTLVYRDGEENKFRRWHVLSHNVTVSLFWSPFLVKRIEKSASSGQNRVYVDAIDERWASEIPRIDVVVFSIGHWFLTPGIYFEKGSVLGCHYCPGQNHTEIGFYDVYRKAIKTALKGVAERSSSSSAAAEEEERSRRVIVTTFSPSHFEGEWDKLGACGRKEPYGAGEKAVEGMEAEMRKIVVEEASAIAASRGVRVEVVDVTGLSLLRPDGHPGPYMYKDPFANGVGERVQNDCVHWCLPGPVDTWNEIMLELMKRWDPEEKRRRW
ncbi:hypothetical protein H6P81_020508 [Aristolochia fimbriata]|uniref:Trichome birefringence-like N-terminal domain-containing protein n=1 Tax=Aristolochia fimbriata TaxID=158543 RepID=A0AAV7DYY5_ARIFI|nr:hypothetical protein H6P81_020508 [Aristolochia fimbriata]